MKNIKEVLSLYNITQDNNYYWKKSENYIGAKIHIIIPFGYINGAKMLIPIYMEFLNNALSLESKNLRSTYRIGMNYSTLEITIIDSLILLPSLMLVWNTMKNLSTQADVIINAVSNMDIVENFKNLKEVVGYNYIKGFEKAYNSMMDIVNNPDKISEAIKLSLKVISEDLCFVIYQSEHRIDYFKRHNLEFKLDNIEYDLEELQKYRDIFEFDNLFELLICQEILHSANVFKTDVKKMNGKYYLILMNEKEFNKVALFNMSEHFDEIFNAKYLNELYSFVGSNLVNIFNNHLNSIDYIVKAFLTDGEVFDDKNEINKIYEMNMDDFKNLFINKIYNRLNLEKKE